MPRIFKGTETLLKLFVPRVDEGNLETLKIGLFTDDTNNAAEFYGDNMSIDGDTVYLRVNAWSFDKMNDGVLNYIAEIEIGEETIITERQSNYFLKTPNQYVPVGPDVDLSNYYTKPEIDEMLEDIEVDVDLTGYATEQWVEDKTYATEQYVNDAIANIDIPEGGGGSTVVELTGSRPTLDEFNILYESAAAGKPTYIENNDGVFNIFIGKDQNALVGRGLYYFYSSNLNVYVVSWYIISTDENAVQESKSRIATISYGVKDLIGSSKDDIKLYNYDGYSDLPKYFYDYGQQLSAPISTYKGKSATFILDGKMYYFDVVNGEKDGIYTKPQVVDLLNIQGGDIDLSSYYTKTEIDTMIGEIESGGGSDCIVIQYIGDYTVDYDGEEVEYNYRGSERQAQNINAIQKILNGEAKAVYYQYLHEQVYRTDEDGYNNKPTWLMMPMVYRYPSHDNIARFMGVINKDEWGGTNSLYAVGIMLNESDASIYNYNESQIETGSGGSSTTSDSCVYYYGSTLRGDEVWSNYENGKLQYVGFTGVDNNGKIIEGSFPLSINSVDEETFTATGFLDESTFVKWNLMAYDSEDIEGNITTTNSVVEIEVSANMGLTNDMAKTIFDNMGNVVIVIKPALFTVNTKYNVTYCVYRATPSTISTTVVTAMNGTELYQWTITSTGEEYTPTKKTLLFE